MSKSNLPKSWTTVTPLSKTLAMILFIALPFIGFYIGTKYTSNHISDLSKNSSEKKETSKPYCNEECWFDTYDGKLGYGKVTGYFTLVEKDGQKCDSFIVPNQGSVFYNLNSRTHASDNTPVLSLNLNNLSNDLTQKIKSSTKNKQVTLDVVQVPKGGHGFKGCMPSSFSVINVMQI